MGLGTCWLGGTFNKKGFSQKLNTQEDEIIPAVSPVGIIFKKRVLKDSIIKKLARSKYRKSWDRLFFEDNFSNPLNEVNSMPYKELLEMVRLAPSASNLQPWRIVKEENKNIFRFFIQRTRFYQRGAGSVDLQFIDMGIALSHFELGAEEMGLAGRWEIEKDIPSPKDRGPTPKREYLVSWIGN